MTPIKNDQISIDIDNKSEKMWMKIVVSDRGYYLKLLNWHQRYMINMPRYRDYETN